MDVRHTSTKPLRESQPIALFTDTYDQINGVAITYQKLASFCSETSRKLDVYTYGQYDSVEELGTVRIVRCRPLLPICRSTATSFDLYCLRRRVLQLCHESRYALIQTATAGSMGIHALSVAGRTHLPLVGVYHTALPECLDARRRRLFRKFGLPGNSLEKLVFGLTWRYISWYYSHCRVVLAPSEPIREQLAEKIGVPTDLFSRGVDPERFSPDHWKPRGKITALYVGRITEQKNLALLERIFGSRADVELMVVGDGPYRKEMEASLRKAQFTGFLKGRDLSEAYASADFFVFPSETDTFGNVVLEAMSSGLPVIVSSLLGPRRLVSHGRNGFVCDDEKEFRDYIDLLISNAELRLKMGREARTFALTQSWDKVFERLFRTYDQVLDQEVAPPVTNATAGDFRQSWESP